MATELEVLAAELAAVQQELAQVQSSTSERIYKLNEENDVLAEANELLTQENARLRAELDALKALESSMAGLAIAEPVVPEDLLTPGSGLYPQTELACIEQAHTLNELSVSGHVLRPHIVASGAVDRCVKVHDYASKALLATFDAGAPVLALAFHPQPAYADYLLANCMDGRTFVLKLNGDELTLVQAFHNHTRQGNVRHAWLSTGLAFVTAASDKTAHLYRLDDATSTFLIAKSYYFNGTVEALAVVPASTTHAELIALAVRDDCYLHYVDCATLEKTRLNMNTDGIEHVSYTILDLRTSPSGKYLLAATDANRHFVFEVLQNVVLRSFYGHKAGPYSQPRVLWHASEKYIVSNNEGDGVLNVWSVASERLLTQFTAHEKLIRDMDMAQGVLLTVSYDKALKVWRDA
ncbi:hypothetical protein SDRG_02794 [Saprolegnia diclina VS20]|uniref:Uncharacterized protein n=1 Tax=Saprolegnia diclina (strain VS20) TaxID=1156394 RepID=T0QPU5_SAPDV|nr:hypothetical protein SDRG_02794 [Saprolegnia diclina VS20]EQC40144.1 hypothetical protein SDRG_02794 [Saprolegnia diclina VS20]|eukprot:XP_008606618.1 hypothetical protein SDRG_02794 [Saprolegnia diclina VS20]